MREESWTAASIIGRVHFTGFRPAPLQNLEVVVNDNCTLKNVFIQLSAGPAGEELPVPSEPVVLEMVGGRYQPRVFGIRTGQELIATPPAHHLSFKSPW